MEFKLRQDQIEWLSKRVNPSEELQCFLDFWIKGVCDLENQIINGLSNMEPKGFLSKKD